LRAGAAGARRAKTKPLAPAVLEKLRGDLRAEDDDAAVQAAKQLVNGAVRPRRRP